MPPKPTGSGADFASWACKRGDSVATLLPNGADLVAVYFAAIQTGLYIVPLNWHLVAAEMAHILNDSDTKVFLADVALRRRSGGCARRRAGFAIGEIAGFGPFGELGASSAGRPRSARRARRWSTPRARRDARRGFAGR